MKENRWLIGYDGKESQTIESMIVTANNVEKIDECILLADNVIIELDGEIFTVVLDNK